jgi:cell pole-organizing protein PopZ
MSNALPVPDPSMDEILASIKRIIESGDEKVVKRAPAAAAGGGTAPGGATAAPSIPAGYAESLRPEVDEDDERPVTEDAGGDHWDTHGRSGYGADAGEPVSGLPDIGEGQLSASDEGAETEYAASGGSRFDEHAFESELLGRVGMISPGAERTGTSAFHNERDELDGPARFAAANSDDAGLRRGSQPTLDEPPIIAARALADPAAAQRLISEEAGARVAASFEDLARAIREDQMRSVEDAVQEMLRPMLQEWLDDNLPRLVERLVREEIERVATGGRR